jgi:hypothetical protein
VLRNLNPSRALRLNFYKLYQKSRVILERYDARLCISMCLMDPGRDLRREIEDEFKKLDPVVPPGVCPTVPPSGSHAETQWIGNRNQQDFGGGDEFGEADFNFTVPFGSATTDWTFEITQ